MPPIYSQTNDWQNSTEPFEIFNSNDRIIYIDYLELVKNKIDGFLNLENNWDGYGGIPPLEAIAEKAKRFLCILNDSLINKISDVFPNPHGTITIEWENNNNEKLSLEIGENNYSYFIEYNHANQFFDGIDVPSIGEITAHLGDIFKNELQRYNF